MNSYKDNFCNYNSTYLLLILIRFVELHCGSYTSYCARHHLKSRRPTLISCYYFRPMPRVISLDVCSRSPPAFHVNRVYKVKGIYRDLCTFCVRLGRLRFLDDGLNTPPPTAIDLSQPYWSNAKKSLRANILGDRDISAVSGSRRTLTRIMSGRM